MRPLLSIVVPSKNRHYYLKFLVEYFKSVRSDKIELIIHDNSESSSIYDFESVIQSCNDSRIKYFYSLDELSVIENCDYAISKATGEYVAMIGDDDIFSKHIIEFTEKFKEEGIDAILPIKSSYTWPDVKPRLYGDMMSGVYSIKNFNIRRTKIDVKKELDNVLKLGGTQILDLPRVYHGIMKREILENIYKETNSYFPGPSPDMANAIAACKFIGKYEIIDLPLIISGHSILSTGGQGAQGQHYGEIDKIKHLPKNTASNWCENVPFYWSGSTIYAESVIKALNRTSMKGSLEKLNFEYLIANCLVFDTNFKDRVYEVYNGKSIKFKGKVKYYVLLIWIKRIKFHLKNNLSLLIPGLKFSKVIRYKKSNIFEVAILNDEMIATKLKWV